VVMNSQTINMLSLTMKKKSPWSKDIV
jgi:hypothetical protein